MEPLADPSANTVQEPPPFRHEPVIVQLQETDQTTSAESEITNTTIIPSPFLIFQLAPASAVYRHSCPIHSTVSQIELPIFRITETAKTPPEPSTFNKWLKKIPFDDLFEVCRWVGKFFYFVCPPLPSSIITKAAFHPPERGKYYFLIAGPKTDRKAVFDAEEAAKLENVIVCFRPFLHRESLDVNIAGGFCRIKVHIVKTRKNHQLVMLYIRGHPSVIANRKSTKVMIISQPNSSDLGACMSSDPSLVDIADCLCCDVVAYDYSGYGCSTGTPSEDGIYSNIEAVYNFVKTELQYEDKDICLFGFSMGTAASIYLASLMSDIGGMILVAPFTSILRIVGKTDNPSTCCLDQFSSYDKAVLIRTRTLICHGMKDSMIGVEHSVVLSRRLQNVADVFYVPMATHRGIYSEPALWTRIRRFVNDELGFTRSWQGLVVFHEESV